jgi:hypothetical protein
MSDQIKAWTHRGWGDIDMELDRCDDEDSDPAERSEQTAQTDCAGKAVQS